jgi:hypothetical protein
MKLNYKMKKFYILLLSFVLITSYGFGQNFGLLFNGFDESVTINNYSDLTLSNNYTIEAWIMASEWKAQSWQGSIVTNDSAGANGGFAFRCGNDGRLSIAVAANNAWNEAVSGPVMQANKWHHVAAVINQGSITLYVDGVVVATASFQGDPAANTDPMTIGESTGFPGRHFDGVIDEVRIWSIARTAEQIATNISTVYTGTEPGLAAYLPMNEGTGTRVTNFGDDNFPGTTVNMGEDNWVEGYQIVDFDVAVSNISNIDRLAMKSRPIKASVDLQNVGARTLDGMSITLELDGTIVATETVDFSLEPGVSNTYFFKTPIDLSTAQNPTLLASISHPQDTNLFNNTTEKRVASRNGLMVNIFENEQHNFSSAGQRQTNSITLPSDLSIYDQIRLRINLNCPNTGCDPWDQPASIRINTSQGIFELGRYITPFGIACGPWYIDVTDFKSILTGEITFESFIQVWGPSGWMLDLDLEFVIDDEDKEYTRLSPIHATDYQVYGDPGISYDLEDVDLSVAQNTETSHIRMQVSGHGQGNTNNAAEFFRRMHQLRINNTTFATHDLWKADCATNTCANQSGTWLFSRAGWCPGQEVIPAIFNTTQQVAPGEAFIFDYQLQDYTNFLNTGYNDSSHTEPHYRIHSYFIENSSTAYNSYRNLAVNEIAFTTSDQIRVEINNDGTVDLANYEVRLYVDGQLMDTQPVSTAIASGSNFVVNFDTTLSDFLNSYFVAEVVEISDENPGDNLLGAVFDGSVSTQDVEAQQLVSVYPNPSQGLVTFISDAGYQNGSWTLYDSRGQQINRGVITDTETVISVENKGLFVLEIVSPNGISSSQKIVIQ